MTTARHIDQGVQDRRHAVTAAVHSTELEGGQITAATRSDFADYVAGDIDVDTVVDRVRSRYPAR